MSSTSNREYELVVFGASGHTGKFAAEHITTHLPTDLRWAVAGRSASKLEAVAAECKSLNPNRVQPAIEICNLEDSELDALAKKTQIILATVGPYSLYGERCFKACAENGTHYFDVTGEVPFVAEMIKKYEDTAKKSGAIMIPECGIESAPPDLMTRILVETIREKYSVPAGEVVISMHEITGKFSGGTLATLLAFLDVYSIKEISASMAPYALSPIPGPKSRDPTPFLSSLFTKISGIKVVPDLGILTTYPAGTSDVAIIHRSWGILGGAEFYGPNFHVGEYMRARNYLMALAVHCGIGIATLLFAIPFIRTVMKVYFTQPGVGATKEESKRHRLEWRGIAKPDVKEANHPRIFCRASFEGSAYILSAMLITQGAISLLRDDHKLSGGIYTPASLGQKYLHRLEDGGMKVEMKVYE